MRTSTGVILALTASISWGLSDFIAGFKSRTVHLAVMMLVTQVAGLGASGIVLFARMDGLPSGDGLLYAALAGVAAGVGIAAFYQGMAVGAIVIVAPITATAAVIPVVFGLAVGERPNAVQNAGMALAIVGVMLASLEFSGEARRRMRIASGVWFGLLAALGFGWFFVGMSAAADAGIYWAVFVERAAVVLLVIFAVAALRPRLSVRTGDVFALVLVGGLDLLATVLFTSASTEEMLSVVSVLVALYPLTTIILARALLSERISRPRLVGIAAALAGVAMISGG